MAEKAVTEAKTYEKSKRRCDTKRCDKAEVLGRKEQEGWSTSPGALW